MVRRASFLIVGAALSATSPASAQSASVNVDTTQRFQTIDGFGTCLSSDEPMQPWWQSLYFDDLGASIVRMDITPAFKSPYSDMSYCSPWFGQGAPLTLDNSGNGPDGTRTREYTSPVDYSSAFGGCSAPIAVMGTDIDKNAAYFDFTTAKAVPGLVAQLGAARAAQLGDFKLYASMWSPAPWVKVSSGNTYGGGASPLPASSVPWPFVWGGNFAGGKLDVSGTPLAEFDDGTGPTSALTQFARGLAAFLHGFQSTYGVKFYAVSIQNELNFEEYYNSATYPLASDYVTALKAARAELDQHPDLQAIKILGPEDLIGGDAYALWQYGSGASATAKNLQFVQAVAADATARAALAGFSIHGYAPDGVNAAGADPQSWRWWASGWTTSPAAGIPGNVQGFTQFGKPSWMTETSGEKAEWLASSTPGGFPDSGAFSIAVKLQQALTTGQESAWLYWQLTDGKPSDDNDVETLTDATQQAAAPKYVAAKHFFKYVRPGAKRVAATVSGSGSANVLASAFVLDAVAARTVVLVNEGATDAALHVVLGAQAGVGSVAAYTSSDGALWQSEAAGLSNGEVDVTVPGYGVMTLYAATIVSGGADGGPGGVSEAGGTDGSSGAGAADASAVDASSPDANGVVGPNADFGGDGSAGCGCRVSSQSPAWPLLIASGMGIAGALRRRRPTR
jgi:MYXO-CTERM domain-containing protein